ncbi:uncharacterized protein K452DRAFT_327100 [Aplosporella prunicola CBS 121167]|uniref:Mob1/phocein n=1 Tax=Aplosporella prunicola CBS 121167 TaxID=1176127 RepID=A0A6A6BFY0_9PEZI|nr:uncharacterized protein K452DRAFT_327100 [Aplosporella prunicola CBS 121167]KAF2141411.1 hypothetical protein K452DRAFT_327100 [Aplosporella prunicola CBS 121167]
MAAMSPSSSPRLPSPPPIAEDQLGPKSPIAEESSEGAPVAVDHGASRRIRPGTKAADMAEGPPPLELKDIESAFQLMEYLKAQHYAATHPSDSANSIPLDREAAIKLSTPPDGVERSLWLYELCRFLTEHANSILIALFADDPPCSAQTCPEMRASEWQYLCAVHDPPKSCCAVDYCCHTLDWAANTLTSPKNFPSRLALGTETSTAHQQIRQLTNVFRRVYRIFAHAWFQHRDMFWKVENKTGLYSFFKVVCDIYSLIPSDNYTIPPEAEGIEATLVEAQSPPTILKKEAKEAESDTDVAGNTTMVTGNTTKRHRHTPSATVQPVTTVITEENEDEEEQADKGEEKAGDEAKEEPASGEEASGSSSIEEQPATEKPAETEEPSAAANEEDVLDMEVSEIAQEAASEEAPREVVAAPAEISEERREETEAEQGNKDANKGSDESDNKEVEKAEEEKVGDEAKPEEDPKKVGESPAAEGEEATKTARQDLAASPPPIPSTNASPSRHQHQTQI